MVLQIETQRAVDARDELPSVPGEFQHPKVVAAMEAMRASCNAHGVAPGTQTRTPALARFWRERGMRFLGCGNEIAFLLDRATEIVKQISQD